MGVWNRHQPMLIHQMISFCLKPIFVLCSHIFHHDVLESEGFTACLIQFGLFALELVSRCSLFGRVWDASDALSDLNVLTWTVSLHFGFVPPTDRLFWTRAKRCGVKRNQNGNNVSFFFLPFASDQIKQDYRCESTQNISNVPFTHDAH